jgi:hypothetical protein
MEGGKIKKDSKKDPNAENIPPPTASIVPHVTALPTAPLSPSKRNTHASHYDGLESSPSKRRSPVLRPSVPSNERGMLFTKPAPSQAVITTTSKIPQRKAMSSIQNTTKAAERAVRKRRDHLRDVLFIDNDLSLELPIIVVD